MYKRECPECKKEINYKNKRYYTSAQLKGKKCKSCSSPKKGILNGNIVHCNTCNKEIYRADWELKERNFCGKDCANKAHSLLLTKYTYENIKCDYCNKEFKPKHNGGKKYCSVTCNARANLKTINSIEPKKKSTKPELYFLDLLKSSNIAYTHQFAVPWKKGWKKWYDFYLPDKNILIEIDGIYWHGKDINNKDLNSQQWNTRKNDRLKNILSKARGYTLIRIWSDEIKTFNINSLKNE
jgi:very-short-patch-repair endonuclease